MAEFKRYEFDAPKTAFAEASKRIKKARKTGAKNIYLVRRLRFDLTETVIPLPRCRDQLACHRRCRAVGLGQHEIN